MPNRELAPLPEENDLVQTVEIKFLESRLSHAATVDDGPPPQSLGRFRLLEKLGQGGMGTVYRAVDDSDGTEAAIKVLSSAIANRPQAVLRFLKEARLLEQVSSKHVTRLIEAGEDAGVHYLAIEYVPGGNLRQLLANRGMLAEARALAIMADVARALADPHERGIVHRDIKPENILLVEPRAAEPDLQFEGRPLVKLTDFGLARHVQQTESLNVTAAGAILGTPIYMSPEQCTGHDEVGPPADVYAMGVTFFELLTGSPPFQAQDAMQLAAKHCHDTPPALQRLNPALSDGVVRIVEKALAKHPQARYATAGRMLRDMERLLRGELSDGELHPALPIHNERQLFKANFTWDLAASPEQLWPYVANTDRLNRAMGLPPVEYTIEVGADKRVRRFGRFRLAGMTIQWEEHPFEWIEGRRMGILREFAKGPFKWFATTVELTPQPGGTRLTHCVRIEPRNLLGRIVARLEAGRKAERSLERIYRRIEATLAGSHGESAIADPFELPSELSARRRRRLEKRLDAVMASGVQRDLAERLGEFVAHAPAQEVARIRPLALARRLNQNDDEVVAACLHAAKEGWLVLLWDILCPSCRTAFEVKDTLRAIAGHGHCDACNLNFELDFANSVELIFRVHPEIRAADTGTYCIGGPRTAPHVVAQVRLQPGERVELDVALEPGDYVLRGPQLPYGVTLRAEPAAGESAPEIRLASDTPANEARTIRSGLLSLAIINEYERELLVRLERSIPRHDVLSAARASSLALFRELYPGEVLTPGQLLSVSTITLLATRLTRDGGLYAGMSDAQAFGLVQRHVASLEKLIGRSGGALIRPTNEGMLAAFGDPAAAVAAALKLVTTVDLDDPCDRLSLAAAVHRGPAVATTLNDRLDYFGRTVATVLELVRAAPVGCLLVADSVASDPSVAELLRTLPTEPLVELMRLPGLADQTALQLPLPGR